MEFDKTKVYSRIDADEIKIGSKGYFADNYHALMLAVLKDDDPGDYYFGVITGISESWFTFCAENGKGYTYFYLVEEPVENKEKEPKYRPYKSIREMFCGAKGISISDMWTNEEMITSILFSFDFILKSKESTSYHKITSVDFPYNNDDIAVLTVNKIYVDFDTLFKNYTWVNGNICGVKECVD